MASHRIATRLNTFDDLWFGWIYSLLRLLHAGFYCDPIEPVYDIECIIVRVSPPLGQCIDFSRIIIGIPFLEVNNVSREMSYSACKLE